MELADLPEKKLGEVSIDKEAFDLDLKINEGYQNYSAELLRVALLILAGLGAVWLKLYLPGASIVKEGWTLNKVTFILSFMVTALAAGAALVHRYTAADSLAYHLTALRRRARNRPAKSNRPSDVEIADKQDAKRNARFQWSGILLQLSIGLLFLGLLLFCLSVGSLMV